MPSRGPLILVVDDDEDIRLSLGQLLSAAGYSVETASDGQDALDRLVRGSKPGLLLLDLRMPRKSGEDVRNALRKSVTLVDLPVIVLSAYLEAPPPGAVAWLKKPVKPSLLLSTIEHYLKL